MRSGHHVLSAAALGLILAAAQAGYAHAADTDTAALTTYDQSYFTAYNAITAEDPAERTRFREQTAELRWMSPDDTTSFVHSEIRRWGEVVKKSGAKVD